MSVPQDGRASVEHEGERLARAPAAALRRRLIALLVLVAGWNAVLVVLPVYPPLLDAPVHAMAARVLGEPSAWSVHYAVRHAPVPGALWHVVAGLLSAVAGPVVAMKLLAAWCVVALPLALLYCARSRGEALGALALTLLPAVFSHFFLFGYLQFSATVPLGLIVIGYAYRVRHRIRPSTCLLLGVMMLALYFGHLVVLAAVVLALLPLLVAEVRSGHRALLWAALLSAVAPISLGAVFLAASPWGAAAPVWIWPEKVNGIGRLLLTPLPTVLLAIAALPAAMRALGLRARPLKDPAVLGIAALFAGWLIAPYALAGGDWDCEPRLLLVALLLAPLAVVEGPASWRRRAAVPAVFAVVVAQGLATYWFLGFLPIQRELARIVAALPSQERVVVLVASHATHSVGSQETLLSAVLRGLAAERAAVLLHSGYWYYATQGELPAAPKVFPNGLLTNRRGTTFRAVWPADAPRQALADATVVLRPRLDSPGRVPAAEALDLALQGFTLEGSWHCWNVYRRAGVRRTDGEERAASRHALLRKEASSVERNSVEYRGCYQEASQVRPRQTRGVLLAHEAGSRPAPLPRQLCRDLPAYRPRNTGGVSP